MAKDLKSKMLNAFTWTTIDRFGQQIIQFVIGVILARLLSTEDYALIGMIIIFIALSTVLVDGGFGQALIKKQDANQKDFNTIFYFNIFVSALLYSILFLTAPLVASFYNEPKLTSILRVLSLVTLLHSVSFIQYVNLIKQLKFRDLAIINIISVIVSGTIGILMAFNGFGVWALVAQQLSAQIIKTILYPTFVRWMPKLQFSFSVIKEFWNFSIPLLSTSILNVLFNNVYFVLLGKYYPKTVGYFYMANKYSETVNFTSQQILQQSTYPLLVQVQDDNERLIRIHSQLTKTISLLFFPLVFILVVVAKPLIITLITEKWLASVILFQLLLTANLFTPLYVLNINVLNSRGLTKNTFNIEIIKKALIVLSILLCFPYGIEIMLIGFIVANYSTYFLSMFHIRKHLNYKIKLQISHLVSGILYGFLVGGTILFFRFLSVSNLALLIIQLSVAAIVYFLIIKLFYPEVLNAIMRYLISKKNYLKIRMKESN